MLVWHHTEFGRRTECGSFRVVYRKSGYQLLDANWDLLAECASIQAGQRIAENIAARAESKQKAR